MNTNTTPKKSFGQVLKAILLFPFKLLWLLLKVVFLLLVLAVLTGGASVYIKSQQPMIVPEAKGMTYQQFMLDRYQAAKALDDNTRENRPDKNPVCVASQAIIMPVIIYFYFSVLKTVAEIYPDSSLAHAAANGDSYHERNRPTGSEPIWWNLPALHWEAVERESWTWLVIRGATSRVCPMPPVALQ